ncbi:MAG: hypothetical protein A2Y77_14800 [Planctomycetes bacterium RBG_13_62_9]|nr:MAG: hypothetical protein A2Y77_14800 [Planctomycetes bacterium RBG_13_62_9]
MMYHLRLVDKQSIQNDHVTGWNDTDRARVYFAGQYDLRYRGGETLVTRRTVAVSLMVAVASLVETSGCKRDPVVADLQENFMPRAARVGNAKQQKDPQQWQDYVNGQGIVISEVRDVEYYRATLPPIWISIPDPDRTSVRLYVYDRAGNRSDPVEMR